jgi:hypothetical protein
MHSRGRKRRRTRRRRRGKRARPFRNEEDKIMEFGVSSYI